jgi:phage host-nuclease inhibitor protein Gam
MMAFNDLLMEERVKRAELEDRVNFVSKQLIEVSSDRD